MQSLYSTYLPCSARPSSRRAGATDARFVFFSGTFVFFSEHARCARRAPSRAASAPAVRRVRSARRSNASLGTAAPLFPAGSPEAPQPPSPPQTPRAGRGSRAPASPRAAAPPRVKRAAPALAPPAPRLAARRDAPMRLCAVRPWPRASRPARVALGRHRPERGEHGRPTATPPASASASPDATRGPRPARRRPPTFGDASGALGERGRPAAAARSAARSARASRVRRARRELGGDVETPAAAPRNAREAGATRGGARRRRRRAELSRLERSMMIAPRADPPPAAP